MHQPVKEILPGIKHADGNDELQTRYGNMVHELGHDQLPMGEDWVRRVNGQERIVAACESTGEERVRVNHAFRDGSGIQAEETEKARQSTLRQTNSSSPHGNIVIGLAAHLLWLRNGKDVTSDDLENLLYDDIARDLVATDMIAARNLLRRVQAVLGEEVVNVDEVEEEGHSPVDDDR